MIPEATVEAGAKAMAGARYGLWELVPEPKRRVFLRDARLALEAAALHMQEEAADDALRAAWDRGYATAIDGVKDIPAQAWDEGESAGQDNAAAYQTGGPVASNPYRPDKET